MLSVEEADCSDRFQAVHIIVNEAMLKDLKKGFSGQHASNLGGILANEIASAVNIPALHRRSGRCR